MTGPQFDTNKSFLLPGALAGLRRLVQLFDEHASGELLVVGHADKRGDPAYNDTLSLDRAKAMAAHLTDDVDAWLAWYDQGVAEEKRWGKVEDALMLGAVADARDHQVARHPLKSYQASRGLKADGVAGPKTRRQLIMDYMGLDGTSLPASIKVVAHGCGEQFPRFVASANNDARDRRVELFLFDAAITPMPAAENSKAGSSDYPQWRAQSVHYERVATSAGRLDSDLALSLTTKFAKQLTPGAFSLWGRAVFGGEIPREAFEQLHLDLRSGNVPNVDTVLSKDLGGHPGAYDAKQRLVLVQDQLALDARENRTRHAAALACTLIEEFGHYLDDLLRNRYADVGGDAPTDEGALFAHLLLSEQLDIASSFRVGTLHAEAGAFEVEADFGDFSRMVDDMFGPLQRATDEHADSLEFADRAALSRSEAQEILYFNLLCAGPRTADAHALVHLARQLNARWRAAPGSYVIDALRPAEKPGVRLERLLLTHLLRLHAEIDARIKKAGIDAEGLPDLSETSWSLEANEPLWDPQSPLAGLTEDIIPFGSHQEWLMRFNELDTDRAARAKRVRQQAVRADAATSGEALRPDTEHLRDSIFMGDGGVTEATAGSSVPLLEDDALNTFDRSLSAYSTATELLEIVGFEIVGGMTVFTAGIIQQFVMFQRTLAIADSQQFDAAKAMGVLFAFFAISKASKRRPLPAKVTRADVEREVSEHSILKGMRESRINWRGATPQSIVQAGEREGIDMTLSGINSHLGEEQSRAHSAFERMILKARVDHMDEPQDERLRIERELSAAYPASWWSTEIRRSTYEAFLKAVQPQALAVYARFSKEGTKQ